MRPPSSLRSLGSIVLWAVALVMVWMGPAGARAAPGETVEVTEVRRFALVVGANDGGGDRVRRGARGKKRPRE